MIKRDTYMVTREEGEICVGFTFLLSVYSIFNILRYTLLVGLISNPNLSRNRNTFPILHEVTTMPSKYPHHNCWTKE